ncbi:Uma2 family endonuclease [Sphingomonas sp. BE138]|uniref:Uma2 family endonuclease n=1 Tax=Sphingomonas sp. BE138 TaxID=2817845 RepID=UPI00285DB649|nr:Uma2 family endonuclease [Sphingomonas sp. BE138]MDR6788008.1 Uma2 family endonuclease [Sphingomonas sp. BE138]
MTVQERLRPGKYRLTVEDYLRLAADGTFGDRRTELIEGDIWIMSPAHTPHARINGMLAAAIVQALAPGSGLMLLVAPSVRLFDDTMPEPDLVVAIDHREGVLPGDKVRLVIEVADSTLATDLTLKRALYARAGIREYWVVDVRGATIHQMWAPSGEDYAERRTVAFGDMLHAATAAGLSVDTAGL